MAPQENQNVIDVLNKQVANFAVMYIKLHHYHWFVQGQLFYELHEKFQELYEEAAEIMDEVAERVLAIQGKPPATMATFLKETTLKEAGTEDEPPVMLQNLQQDFQQISKELKEGIKMCERQEDVASADLLTNILGKLEKHMWMIRSVMAEKNVPVHA